MWTQVHACTLECYLESSTSLRFKFSDPAVQSRNRHASRRLTRSRCFSAVPSAPYAITLLSCDGASMTLAWKRPKHTGGSRITSYFLDKREADSVLWKEVSSRPATSRVYKVSSSDILWSIFGRCRLGRGYFHGVVSWYPVKTWLLEDWWRIYTVRNASLWICFCFTRHTGGESDRWKLLRV